MKDETSTVSPEFEAFVESLDPDTRAFLDKLRRPAKPLSNEEELRWFCEQHQELREAAEGFHRRLRGYDELRPTVEALTERLRRVEEIVSRFKTTDEGADG